MINNQIIKRPVINYGLISLVLLMLFNSCKREFIDALPDEKEDTGLNFYAATDVMEVAYKNNIAIYVDQYQNPIRPIIYDANNLFATFGFGGSAVSKEYPAPNSTGINYVRYVTGNHRLMFTDTANTVVLDTSVNLSAKGYTCVYLTDVLTDINAPAVYKMVAVEENRLAVPTGQVAVRFIHLSADAGTLRLSRIKADGSLTNALPAELHFGDASSYQYYTAADTTSGLLRFSVNNTDNSAALPTGVPYTPGKRYVVVISGFVDDQQRQIARGKNPDGSIKYQSVIINRNFHTSLRRAY